MTQSNRIAGGLVDRSKQLSFTFNNKQMTGYFAFYIGCAWY